ncbi:putative Asparagine synthase family protein [Paratrimastix pyriformis]|uniref:Asparagine synthase family protein n=1 Tax=Paratrimastix pyriformis TaxID=342808 RepID=A0ABQ8UTD3_9EUKA|nr:putative Asparagine synthase family protein [Paratrimastix pyriformis]
MLSVRFANPQFLRRCLCLPWGDIRCRCGPAQMEQQCYCRGISPSDVVGRPVDEVLRTLRSLWDPWTLTWWNPGTKTLLFGKDWLGRGSLSVHWPTSALGQSILSSCRTSRGLPADEEELNVGDEPDSVQAAPLVAVDQLTSESAANILDPPQFILPDDLHQISVVTPMTQDAGTPGPFVCYLRHLSPSTSTSTLSVVPSELHWMSAPPETSTIFPPPEHPQCDLLRSHWDANTTGFALTSTFVQWPSLSADAPSGFWAELPPAIYKIQWPADGHSCLGAHAQLTVYLPPFMALTCLGPSSLPPLVPAPDVVAALQERLLAATRRMMPRAMPTEEGPALGGMHTGWRSGDSGISLAGGQSPTPFAKSIPHSRLFVVCPSPMGVLFSGGLDSTLVAALLGAILPPAPRPVVELVNVCFGPPFESHDRAAAVASHADLLRCAPHVDWRLLFVDVTAAGARAARGRLDGALHPRHTVMDANIGAVLWFGCGGCRSSWRLPDRQEQAVTVSRWMAEGPPQPAEIRTRLFFSGLGPDELGGGYRRHHAAARQQGPEAARKEMMRDMGRLWVRNLGRDCRLVEAAGCEARFPYLDTSVVHWLLSQLPLQDVVKFEECDKTIFRKVALRMGCPAAAGFVKRAMQFGSRAAKVLAARSAMPLRCHRTARLTTL